MASGRNGRRPASYSRRGLDRLGRIAGPISQSRVSTDEVGADKAGVREGDQYANHDGRESQNADRREDDHERPHHDAQPEVNAKPPYHGRHIEGRPKSTLEVLTEDG